MKNTSEASRFVKRSSGLNGSALVLAALAVIVALAGCDRRQYKVIDLSDRIDDDELTLIAPSRDSGVLRFGFALRGSPDEDARQYLPFLEYLEHATGLRFELRFTPQTTTVVDMLGTGELDFAAVGAESYLEAHERYGVILLVRGLNATGRSEYRSVIVVAPDSPIQEIEDLRGKSLAFGRVGSTPGHLVPLIVLAEHGMSLDDLASYGYTGSHQDCASAVAAGRFDAGGVQDTLGQRLAEAGFVRIIHTSGFYPSSGIAANRDVPLEVTEKVKQALLQFQPTGAHAEGLYHWDRTEMANGFSEARDEDYAELREWSSKFGLLDAPARGEAQ
ncbi:MAG: phosphate/phosphite/phosphonate ABC transporter substrate-binding protein [Spirochaetaceae bacterium]|nr:phosphate/phosphite/phosphonate ABC transporter substrate-binding protein [Spirochaetaceae bacterium]